MSYKNIVYAKLEKRLFNDHRWYMMSEPAQLNYIRFILFAQETYNKIPKNLEAIKKAFKTDQDLMIIESTIKEIKINFPKFKENKHFYYFDGFDEKTNYIPTKETPRKSSGCPQDGVEEEEEEEKEKDKEKEEEKETAYPDWLPLKEFLDYKNMRKQIKRPMSVAAERLAIGMLARLREKGNDPKDVLEQSILNSWQGLFELKNKKGGSLADKYPAL